MSPKKIQKLEKEILKHKELYYKGKAILSDSEYDDLEESLRLLDPQNITLEIIGSPVKSKNKVAHDTKMLSLDKCYEVEELLKWKKDHDIVGMYKIDGSSCSLVYKSGKLEVAKTRGDGVFGEDITSKAIYIDSIPKAIDHRNEIEIRGEIYCEEKRFKELSDEMELAGLDRPQSMRNIVAGLLGRKEKIYLSKYLSFFAFEVINKIGFKTEVEKNKFVNKLGFKSPEVFKIKEEKEIVEKISEYEVFSKNGSFLVDGLVFTFNEVALHEKLGATSHHPKYKMAFKLRGETARAIIEDITWQVSRNGVLTPVAEIVPVELSGAKISRVTLHNFGIVFENFIKPGDEIEIIRSGEVIPKYLKTVKESKFKFSYPKKCPSCNGKVDKVEIRLICNNEDCFAKKLESILHFIKVMDIEDLSVKRLEEMLKTKLVKNIPDLYSLTKEDLLTLDKTKETLATKLLYNINNSLNTNTVKFITALGLTGGGENKCQKIVDAGYESVDSFLRLTSEELIEIEGFAKKSSESLIESLDSKKELVKELLSLGFKFRKQESKGNRLKGQSFCITGKLSRGRSEIEKDIKENGGKSISSISSKTDFLICNEENSKSSKFKKAQSLEIKIITEQEFEELIFGENKI